MKSSIKRVISSKPSKRQRLARRVSRATSSRRLNVPGRPGNRSSRKPTYSILAAITALVALVARSRRKPPQE